MSWTRVCFSPLSTPNEVRRRFWGALKAGPTVSETPKQALSYLRQSGTCTFYLSSNEGNYMVGPWYCVRIYLSSMSLTYVYMGHFGTTLAYTNRWGVLCGKLDVTIGHQLPDNPVQPPDRSHKEEVCWTAIMWRRRLRFYMVDIGVHLPEYTAC